MDAFKIIIFLFVVAFAALLVLAMRSVAHAEPMCFDREVALKKWRDELNMVPTWTGADDAGNEFIMLSSLKNGKWAMLVAKPGPSVCILLAGPENKLFSETY